MNNTTKNIILAPFNWLYKVCPEMELKLLFRLQEGYSLNLSNPKTYNEKLQWIKLYDHNPLMPECCDKYAVRNFVEKQGCGELLNHLIWEGYDPKKIPFNDLPEKFVIKVTHGSTFNIICTNLSELNRNEVITKCTKWLKAKFLPCYGEWFYGKIKPRIIIEDYIESDDGKQLRDYKVFCFNGEPKYICVDSDRFTKHKNDIFTIDWKRLPGIHIGCCCSEYEFEKPECLKELLDVAKKLSQPFLHARIDFYIVRNKIIFGEITFTNGAGFDRFSSYNFDLEMGEQLNLIWSDVYDK